MITFETKGHWYALIADFVDESPPVSGEGGTAKEAKRDLYNSAKALRPGLETLDGLSVSATTAAANTVLASLPTSESEKVTLDQLCSR